MTYSPRSPLRAALRGPLYQATTWEWAINDPFGDYTIGSFPVDLVADFVNGVYKGANDNSPVAFGDLFTFGRASAGTFNDASGVLQTASSGNPRIGHHVWNGSAWVNQGLRLESAAATNLLHTTNALVTQTVTVTAVAHTLHFTGTGTVTLSGVSTAGPLVGTGTGENNRVSLTFTPTAGSLTLTVSGTVTNAQLETGSVRSSYIANTAGSGTATRAAETLTIAAANMPYSATAISLAMKGALNYADNNQNSEAMFYQWILTDYIRSYLGTNGAYVGGFAFQQFAVSGGGLTGSSQAVPGTFTPGLNKSFGVASRHGSTFLQGAANGISLTASATPTAMPNISSANFQIGSTFNGTIDTFRAWSADIAQAGIEEASS